jgi:putative PEP-CTERM system TPR-repeat lipoprotein
MYMRNGQPSQAAVSLQRAADLAPDNAAFKNQLALGLIASGDESAARNQLDTAIALDEEQFQSDYLKAMLSLRDGDLEAAEEAARAVIAKSPENPMGYNVLGAIALSEERTEDAVSSFEKALEVDPKFVPAVANLARVAESAGDIEGAQGHYQALLDVDENNESALIGLAQIALRQSDTAGAEAHLKQAVEHHPDSVSPRLLLLSIYRSTNDLIAAADQADAALEIQPDAPTILAMKADIDLRQGDRSSAEMLINRLQVQTEGTENVQLLNMTADLQAKIGNLLMAKADYQSALDLQPGNIASSLGLVQISLAQRRFIEAREKVDVLREEGLENTTLDLLEARLFAAENKFDEAVPMFTALADQNIREGATELAVLHYSRGNFPEGSAVLTTWLARHPADLGARLMLANSHLQAGDNAQAIIEYEKMLPSTNAILLNNLAWLYSEKGDSRALETARKARESAPQSAEIADTLGWILVEAGKSQEALDYLRQAARELKDNPSVQYHLGVAHFNLGNEAEARVALQSALAEGKSFPEASEARRTLELLGES